MSVNTKDKTILFLCDFPSETEKKDIETFLSQYKDKITSISVEQKPAGRDFKKVQSTATVSFKDNKSANDCRLEMNLKKIKKKSVRIMWEEKYLSSIRNNDKNNLNIRGIPKAVTPREVFEYFIKFGDIFSIKINEDENGNHFGSGYIIYYNQDDAKKAIEQTKNKKIWDTNIELSNPNKPERNRENERKNDKIYISNIPEKYTESELKKFCEGCGSIINCNINKDSMGKLHGVVQFSNGQEAQDAISKLNNKEINGNKINVKPYQVKYEHYNKPNYFYEKPYSYPTRYNNDSSQRSNLYIKNIPLTAKEEDIRQIFSKFGEIKSMKIETYINERKDKGEVKTELLNKGYGYILFDNEENATKALESLSGKCLPGYESSWPKPLLIDFFLPKDKRENNNIYSSGGFYNLQNNQMMFPMKGQFVPQYTSMVVPMQIPNQYKNQYMGFGGYPGGNYKNEGYPGYRQKYNNSGYQHRGRGGHRGGGGHYKNNGNINYRQHKNNNINNNNTNTASTNDPNISAHTKNDNSSTTSKVNKFDHESFNKLTSDDEKRDFLGERLYTAIQNSPLLSEKDESSDIVAKITGMIIDIPDFNEIIEILEKPSALNARIDEALKLLKDKP